MSKSRATDEILDLLHLTTAQAYLDEIQKYKDGKVLDKDGNALPVPAALLAGAARFLKDNGIDRPGQKGDALDLLNDEMPTFDNHAYN